MRAKAAKWKACLCNNAVPCNKQSEAKTELGGGRGRASRRSRATIGSLGVSNSRQDARRKGLHPSTNRPNACNLLEREAALTSKFLRHLLSSKCRAFKVHSASRLNTPSLPSSSSEAGHSLCKGRCTALSMPATSDVYRGHDDPGAKILQPVFGLVNSLSGRI